MKFEFSPYIAVQVQDNDKAVDFYKRVLGMEFIDSKGNDTYMDKDGINFVIENNPEGAGAVFFEFKTDNLTEAREALVKEGCTVLEAYGPHSIMFSDPFGMNFHVWEDGAFPDNP
jgi:catechol 2,3-dioxygenase-like lactoylglutathione lyase family enzyme